MWRWRSGWFAGVALALVAAGLVVSTGARARAQGGDYAVAYGRVYTQTAGANAPEDAGFLISDRDGVPFWTEFQRRGGPDVLGYPVTQRFEWKGFATQALQKAVFQWRPEIEAVVLVNIMDELSAAGLDPLLEQRLTPPWRKFEESGLPWEGVQRQRLALLDASAPLKAFYFGRSDWLDWFGLPTSEVVAYRDVVTIRLQRTVLQLWRQDTPWARAGAVTAANAGDLAKQHGLFPRAATVPAVPGDPILERANLYRATMGLPPLTQSPELMRAAQAHADYYIRNMDDPNAGGLHNEVRGKPGFTGESIYDRAKNAGYALNWIDETFGFLGPQRTLDWAMGTVYHRYMFVHPSAADIGYGTASRGRTTVAIFNVGLAPNRTASVPMPTVYPIDGATDVPASWDGGESPDPAPGIARPLGPPVTLQFGLNETVVWGSAALYGPSGAPVAAAVTTSQWRRALALVPHDPLRAGATYRVEVNGTRGGVPFAFSSSFTTAG
ncbi:MAG: hypothetical protein FJ029_04500 [Actinobacteria bacterium]|nr:hypothetical protein [Actinomycetota bacterium]